MKTYSIYQITDTSKDAYYIKFCGLDVLKRLGLKPTKNIYSKVYEGYIKDSDTILDDIYYKFNMKHPEDFKGHSLSVSDVVELDGKFYYCDSYGWTEIWK